MAAIPAPELTLIKGSEGEYNYLVVARSKGAVVSIRPALVPWNNGKSLGTLIRVRVCKDPESTLPVPAWTSVLPSVKFEKNDAKRASFVFGVVLVIAPSSPYIPTALAEIGVVGKLMTDLRSKIAPLEFILPELVLRDYIQSAFVDELKKMGTFMGVEYSPPAPSKTALDLEKDLDALEDQVTSQVPHSKYSPLGAMAAAINNLINAKKK